MPTIEELYQTLVRDPRRFLSNHVLKSATSGSGQAEQVTAYFTCRDQDIGDHSPVSIRNDDPPGAHTLRIKVFHLPTIPYQVITRSVAYPWTAPPPADIEPPEDDEEPYNLYVTAPLNACTLVCKLDAQAGPALCHIQPEAGMEGGLENALKCSHRPLRNITAPPDFFGRTEYGNGYLNVVGIGRGARWKFYQQFMNIKDVDEVERVKKLDFRGHSRFRPRWFR